MRKPVSRGAVMRAALRGSMRHPRISDERWSDFVDDLFEELTDDGDANGIAMLEAMLDSYMEALGENERLRNEVAFLSLQLARVP